MKADPEHDCQFLRDEVNSYEKQHGELESGEFMRASGCENSCYGSCQGTCWGDCSGGCKGGSN